MAPVCRLDGVLARKRDDIVEAFVTDVRIAGHAFPHVTYAEIARPAAMCVDVLTRREPDVTALGVEYARDRHRLGYDLRALLVEIGLLRESMLVIMSAHLGTHPGAGFDRCVDLLHQIAVEAATELEALRHPMSPKAMQGTARAQNATTGLRRS